MFDLANQSFTLLINTLLFAIFFKEVVVADERIDDTLWSAMIAASLALVVIASPVAGAIADARAIKKPILLGLGVACVALTCSLALIPDAHGAAWGIALAMALYIPANFCYQLGENFLASFLPEIATRERMGRISGLGWAMGYTGALILLALTGAWMSFANMQGPADWRPLFIFAGLWFLLVMIPTALYLPERAHPDPRLAGQNVFIEAARRLSETLQHARRFRHLARFFLAFLVYGFGVQVVIFFSSPIAKEFGIEGAKLVLFLLQLTVVAGITAIATSAFQDRLGHKRTVRFFLIVWTINALGLAAMANYAQAHGAAALPQWPIWIIGNGMGIGLGGIGTASRALVGAFTPAHRTAEFFGLWGVTYKLAGCIGVLSFGVAKDTLGSTAALLLLAGFFITGFLILTTVSQTEGVAAAKREEEEWRQIQPGNND